MEVPRAKARVPLERGGLRRRPGPGVALGRRRHARAAANYVAGRGGALTCRCEGGADRRDLGQLSRGNWPDEFNQGWLILLRSIAELSSWNSSGSAALRRRRPGPLWL